MILAGKRPPNLVELLVLERPAKDSGNKKKVVVCTITTENGTWSLDGNRGDGIIICSNREDSSGLHGPFKKSLSCFFCM